MNTVFGNDAGNKVITTMMIRALNDRTYCVRYTFTHLGFWRKLQAYERQKFLPRKCLLKRALLTFSSISNHLAAICKGGLFDSPVRGLCGACGRG